MSIGAKYHDTRIRSIALRKVDTFAIGCVTHHWEMKSTNSGEKRSAGSCGDGSSTTCLSCWNGVPHESIHVKTTTLLTSVTTVRPESRRKRKRLNSHRRALKVTVKKQSTVLMEMSKSIRSLFCSRVLTVARILCGRKRQCQQGADVD
ncbi:hypothetical protein EYF80_018252 [Liparis tanakae]|uniref:Uncharacterized protein n=1 Tax=Liparis tanakae TaxID=230148 RepID=A0A4Z2I0J9_9TELE|nr:hypothetical protein EYF80_018252 [Liparis tanakae]